MRILVTGAQDHIRQVFFNLPITVVSADDQLKAMCPPSVVEMIASEIQQVVQKKESDNDLSEMQRRGKEK